MFVPNRTNNCKYLHAVVRLLIRLKIRTDFQTHISTNIQANTIGFIVLVLFLRSLF